MRYEGEVADFEGGATDRQFFFYPNFYQNA